MSTEDTRMGVEEIVAVPVLLIVSTTTGSPSAITTLGLNVPAEVYVCVPITWKVPAASCEMLPAVAVVPSPQLIVAT